MVPVETLRQALEDSGMDEIEANRVLGWNNIEKVRRITGSDTKKRKVPLTHIDYDTAAEFVQGLDLWPVDYGL